MEQRRRPVNVSTAKNLRTALLQILPAATLAKLLWLQSEADERGIKAFLVGGVVRDLLLGRPTTDVDVVLEADALAFAISIASSMSAQVRGHEAFRTATLSFEDGTQLDLVTARSEEYPHPGVLPVITPGTIGDDLARRDFSINTLAMRLNAACFGDVLDRHSGRADLEQGVIRALHPRSFVEDPTRLFRAIRYAERYGFSLDPTTLQWFGEAVADGALDTVSGVRIQHELVRVFAELRCVGTLRTLDSHRLLKGTHSTWRLSQTSLGRLTRIDTVASHCQQLAIPSDTELLCWMALFSDLSPEDAEILGQRLVLDAKTVQMCVELHRLLQQIPKWSESTSPSTVYHYCRPLDDMLVAFACWSGPTEYTALRRYLQTDRQIQPWITGNHLMQCGLPPGPEYTKILWQSLAAQLDGAVQTPEDALRQIREKVACQKQH